MLASGLLWYDDDASRPLAFKLAEAADRYRERVGYEPTACQLNPTQAQAAQQPPAPAAIRRGAKRGVPLPPITLRLIPAAHLRPNYFFVGVEEGDQLRRVSGWHDDLEDLIDHTSVRRQSTRPPAAVARPTPPSKPAALRVARPTETATPAKTTKKVARSGPELERTPMPPASMPPSHRRSAKAEKTLAEAARAATPITAPTAKARKLRRAAESGTERPAAAPARDKETKETPVAATRPAKSVKMPPAAHPASAPDRPKRPPKVTHTQPAKTVKPATTVKPARAAKPAQAPATPPPVLPVARRKRPAPPAASQATLWSEPAAEAPAAPARRRKTA
ncbi:MAG TPA: hypothetical protein VLJ14_09800 [Ktedonobacterales bacterium]|nr:hypothetical protein [Ktedonobacterales bacterium]